MRAEAIFPGQNSIGKASIEKLDASDTILSGIEGLVAFSIPGVEGNVPGVFLKDLEFGIDVMEVLTRSAETLTLNPFFEKNEAENKYFFSIKINPTQPEVDDINFTLSFGITEKSFKEFQLAVEETNRIVLIIKSKEFFLFIDADPTSGIIKSKEVELYN
jgi:hypothetical protein